MVRQGRTAIALQVVLLVSASLLEVAANFAANDMQSSAVRTLARVALPAVAVLLLLLIVGNVLVFRLENPGAQRPVWSAERAPYPGLSAFTEDDSAVYFGREAQISELVRRLHALDQDAAARFVCLTGASGSGKSSLVHAGVLPRLRARRWRILPVVVPAGMPLAQLDAALAAGSGQAPGELMSAMREDPGALADAVTRLGRDSRQRLLLVVDQLEELVTLSGDADRELFLAQVAGALAAQRRLWVVVTLRIEFLPQVLASRQPQLFAAPVALGAMRPVELATVVEAPAALAGFGFETGLVSEIVDDTATVDALPLLAYLLQELYLTAGRRRVATRAEYRALGGVAGGLARQADLVFGELREEFGAELVLGTLLGLVGMDGVDPTRRRVVLAELSRAERRIIAAFTDARLVVTGTRDGQPVAQVAHEALFRQWPPLRQLVAARSEQLRSRSELERWAADWLRAGRSADYLLTGERLMLAGQWLDALDQADQASQDVRELVKQSRSRDRAFLSRVAASIGTYVLANVDQHPEFAILLTAAALAECPPVALARRALMASLANSHAQAVLAGHTGAVRGVAWAPDGRRVATASRDGSARIWDATSGTTEHVLRGHGAMLEAVAWSPDSRRVATAGRDKTVRVWDAATGGEIVVLDVFGDVARGVAWSPDGSRLAATSRDRVVRVFDTETWQLTGAWAGHGGDVWGVAWSPDGSRVATASHDKTVIVWDAAGGDVLLRLDGHTNFVEAVAWSPDGARLATASGDTRVRIWDATSGTLLRTISGFRDPIWSVGWSPGGRRIAYASGNRTARIWGVEHDDQLAVLRGHGEIVWAVAWSPDGTRIVTGSEDGTARIWTAAAEGAERQSLVGHTAGVRTLTLCPDGSALASGSHDGTLRTWDTATGRVRAVLRGHDGAVSQTAWSPDGTTIASCADDNTVRLWDPADGGHRILLASREEAEALTWAPDSVRLAVGLRDNTVRILDTRSGVMLAQLRGHGDWVGTLAWSPSGRLIASGSDDRTARIWDVETGRVLRELAGHQNWVDGVAWSPDEKLIATCSGDWTIRIWDAGTGGELRKLTGHERPVRTWDPHAGRELDVIGVHPDRVGAVAWLPDGKHVASGSTDRTIRIWSAQVDVDTLVRTARRRVFRSLTPEERLTHLLPDQPAGA
jgi:WD40 repeat protein